MPPFCEFAESNFTVALIEGATGPVRDPEFCFVLTADATALFDAGVLPRFPDSLMRGRADEMEFTEAAGDVKAVSVEAFNPPLLLPAVCFSTRVF